MSPDDETPSREQRASEVARKVTRKLKARRRGRKGVWFGLGMFGLVGWAVAVPTLIGVAVGVWLDKVASAGFSWTLALLVVGVCLGCWNAWRWIEQERSDD